MLAARLASAVGAAPRAACWPALRSSLRSIPPACGGGFPARAARTGRPARGCAGRPRPAPRRCGRSPLRGTRRAGAAAHCALPSSAPRGPGRESGSGGGRVSYLLNAINPVDVFVVGGVTTRRHFQRPSGEDAELGGDPPALADAALTHLFQLHRTGLGAWRENRAESA